MFYFYMHFKQREANESSDLMKWFMFVWHLICVFLSMKAAVADRETSII